METRSRLGLLRRSPSFGLLFLATAGSAIGTYLAAIALTIDIKNETGSGIWVAALLIADFLPIVLIGLLFGPLVDRLSRRGLMIVSDLVRFGVFAALPFVDSPYAIVALAGVAGIATGFFRPAAFAGLPNLVDDDELTNANSLVQTVETLAWMIGPIIGGVLLAFWSPSVPYAVNAVTFLVSAVFIARISEAQLRSDESLTAGYWRDVGNGIKLVLTSKPLRTVLVVWNVVILGSAAINVAEVFVAQDVLDGGTIGFGVVVAASGVGLAIGSFLAPPAIGRVGLRRHWVGSIVLLAFGWGGAALSPSIYVAVPFVVAASVGNGAAIVSNAIFMQRGAPDQYRGRALATMMSLNYAVFGLAMAGAGILTNVVGPREVWMGAAVVYAFAALVAYAMTGWLAGARDEHVLDEYGEAAAVALAKAEAVPREPIESILPPVLEDPEPALVEDIRRPRREAAPAGLDRIADLLEEIEARRELEARRS